MHADDRRMPRGPMSRTAERVSEDRCETSWGVARTWHMSVLSSTRGFLRASMSHRFVRCPHCKMPHDAAERVCPNTGLALPVPVDARKPGREGRSRMGSLPSAARAPDALRDPRRGEPPAPPAFAPHDRAPDSSLDDRAAMDTV